MSLTFAVGDLTIHRVIESEAPLFDPLTFFPTLTRELLDENLSWLKPDLHRSGQRPADAVHPVLHRAHAASQHPDR